MSEQVDVVLGTLFTAFGKTLDDASALLYERGLADVPLALLDAAVTRSSRALRSYSRTPKRVDKSSRAGCHFCRASGVAIAALGGSWSPIPMAYIGRRGARAGSRISSVSPVWA